MLKKAAIGLAAVALLAYLANLAVQLARRSGVNQGYEPDQPIAYSHKVHAGDNEIPCLYCHTGAEKGRHAGIPPAQTCMNCHAQIKKDSPEIAKIRTALETGRPIEWIKVHRLPDFAYFNHSQHVAVAGLDCQTCHGPVETMTRLRQEKDLTMGWCISCHREKGVVPGPDHQDPQKATGGEDCAKCHY